MTKPALILTRPAPACAAFAASLPAALLSRVRVVTSPLLRILPTAAPVDLGGIGGVIFTSANGVAHGPKGGTLPAYCVGEATAQAAAAKGWQVAFHAPDAARLLSMIKAHHPAAPLLHLRGTHQRGDIAERLTQGGLPTRAVALYDQQALPLTRDAQAALADGPSIVPLFSPRTAAQFADQAHDLQRSTIIALSPAVAEALDRTVVQQILIAPEPTATSLRFTLETAVDWNRLA
ncbi:uroporphyrinogen-III synthase [Sulfitobacter sp. M39]|uniref:uroporphyrinogen-III synthase n=1 Tax=Sulfitobacter sp. M39 TaxID=2675334 RepID=UPI001F3DC517|nr:uroporphyrinogen-III synthase [Sulfitobacter sp. M39]